MSTKHTPKPWTRVPQNQGGDLIAHPYETGDQMNPKGLRLVAFMLSRHSSLAEDEANADLITAAPEMLEALRGLVQLVEDYSNAGCEDITDSWTKDARAAIAKATGSV